MTLTTSFKKRKDVKRGFREEIRISCNPNKSRKRFVQVIGYKKYEDGSAVIRDKGEFVKE